MYKKDKTAEGKVTRCDSFSIAFKGGIGPTEAILWIAAAVLVADSRTGNEPRLNSSAKNCDFLLLRDRFHRPPKMVSRTPWGPRTPI